MNNDDFFDDISLENPNRELTTGAPQITITLSRNNNTNNNKISNNYDSSDSSSGDDDDDDDDNDNDDDDEFGYDDIKITNDEHHDDMNDDMNGNENNDDNNDGGEHDEDDDDEEDEAEDDEDGEEEDSFSLSSDSDMDSLDENVDASKQQQHHIHGSQGSSVVSGGAGAGGGSGTMTLEKHLNEILNLSELSKKRQQELDEERRRREEESGNKSSSSGTGGGTSGGDHADGDDDAAEMIDAGPMTANSIFQTIKKVIEERFVKAYEQKINYMCGPDRKTKLKLVVEWSTIESIVEKDLDTAENCIQTLQMALLWENMKKGVMRFITEDVWQRHFFNDTVSCIVIDFSFTKDQKTDINLMAGMGILCYQINVSVSGDVLRPYKVYEPLKERAEQVKKNFGEEMDLDDSDDDENSDFTETDEENVLEEYEVEDVDEADEVIEDEDLVTGKVIEDLRRVAIHPSVSQRNSLEYLLRVLRSENPYWKPNKSQKSLIFMVIEEIRKKKSEKSEVVVKAWMVTKMNKKAMRQERVFVLTDRRFYTAKAVVDHKKRYIIDEKHIKYCSLNRVFLIDVARFKPNPTETKFQPFAMAIYADKSDRKLSLKGNEATGTAATTTGTAINGTGLRSSNGQQIQSPSASFMNESPSSSISSSPSASSLIEEYADDSDNENTTEENPSPVPSSTNNNTQSPPSDKKPKKQKKAVKILTKVTKHAKKGAKKLLTHTDKPEESQNEDDMQQRPSTEASSITYIMAPNDIHQSDNQQQFLLEIAWCIYAAASARQGSNPRILRPFQNYRINKPRANAYSSIYNKLNMGSTL